jgi:nucleotide-binding universal stress UspA family protein
MFKQILVPLDGSARAEQALPVAACLARAAHGTITLVQAVYPPSVFIETAGTYVLPDILDENVPEAKEYLEGIAHMSSLGRIPVVTEAVTGHPAQAIIAAAREDKVDLVVMCSHGYTEAERWAMGSVSAKVARYAPAPVLILHEGHALSTEVGDVPPGAVRVLVPLDGSARAEAALVPAALLAWALVAPAPGALHLTRVVHATEEEAAEAQQYLRTVAQRLQQELTESGMSLDLPTITWSVTVADDAASGIMQAAAHSGKGEETGQGEGCQVIAMVTHGLGGPQLWAMGSTTERVLHEARQPLLIVRR